MKTTKEFMTFVNKASKLKSNSRIEIIKYMWFHDNNKVSVTNLDIYITIELKENHNMNGILINTKEMFNVTKVWKEFEIFPEDNKIYATNGKAKHSFAPSYMDENDFPDPPDIKNQSEIPVSIFKNYLDAYDFTAKNPMRFERSEVFIDKDLSVASTNGKMAFYASPIDIGNIKYSMIVPKHNIFTDIKPSKLSVTPNYFIITDNNITYIICIIDSVFPDIKGVINITDSYFNICFNKDIHKVMKSMHKFMKLDKTEIITLTNNKISYDTDTNNYEEQYNFECDKKFEFSFNINYFEKALKHINTYKIKYKDKMNPLYMVEDNKTVIIMLYRKE